jgi:carboxylate-amine ligase
MRTFGVEEELLLIDPRTGAPLALSPQALSNAPAVDDGPELDYEIQQEMIETQSRPHTLTTDLLADVAAGRALADSMVQPLGGRAVALAASPFRFRPHPTRNPRYDEMVQRYGVTAWRTLACGLHVHVAIESREEGVAVLDRIRNWLPVLLALSANSPYADGADTGYASFRFTAWHQWQSAGPTDVFGSVEAYDAFEEELVATEVIMDAGMLYFDARLSHKRPTVEVRITDVCLDPRDTVVLAALVRGLVDTAALEAKAGVPPVRMSSAALRLAAWQASLTGVTGRLPHPQHGHGTNTTDSVAALVDHVRPALIANGDLDDVEEGLKRIFARGGGAGDQRRAYARRGALLDVIDEAVAITHSLGAGAGESTLSAI